MEKKSFVFYTSWNNAIKQMDEQQLRRFITNLCNYAEGTDVHLDGVVDEIMWSQVKPLLDYNEGKRQKRIENGRKGGAPVGNSNATKNNLNQAKQANQAKTSVEGRRMREEGRGMMEEGRGLKEEGRGMMVEGRRKKVEGKKVEGKKVDVEGLLSKYQLEQLMIGLKQNSIPVNVITAVEAFVNNQATSTQRDLIQSKKEKLNQFGVLKPLLQQIL
jgi:hypothetical protein